MFLTTCMDCFPKFRNPAIRDFLNWFVDKIHITRLASQVYTQPRGGELCENVREKGKRSHFKSLIKIKMIGLYRLQHYSCLKTTINP